MCGARDYLLPSRGSVVFFFCSRFVLSLCHIRLQLGEVRTTIPTIGFNVETVAYRNITFTVWDVGGQHKIRRLWRHYYQNTNGLIFVVDSTDDDRFKEAKEELHLLLSDDEMRDAKVLIYANKQDLPQAKSPSILSEKLNLRGLTKHEWHIQPCSAVTGAGLYEGLDWLSKTIGKSSKK